MRTTAHKKLTSVIASVAMMTGGLALSAPAQAAPAEGDVAWGSLLTVDSTNFGLYGTNYPSLVDIPSEAYAIGNARYNITWPQPGTFTTAQGALIRCATADVSSCGSIPTVLETVTVNRSDANPETSFRYLFSESDIGQYARVRLRTFTDSIIPVETLSDPILMLGRPPTNTQGDITVSYQATDGRPIVTDGSQIIVQAPGWDSPNMNFGGRLLTAFQCPDRVITSVSGCTRLADRPFTNGASRAEPTEWAFSLPALSGTGFLQIRVRNRYATNSGFAQLWDRGTSEGTPMISQATVQQAEEATATRTEVAERCLAALGGVTLPQVQADGQLLVRYQECIANNGQLPQDETPANPTQTDPTQTEGTTPSPAAPNVGGPSRASEQQVGAVTARLIALRAVKRGKRMLTAVTVSPTNASSRAILSLHRCGKVDGKRNCTVPGKRVKKLKRANIVDGIGLRANRIPKKLKPGRYALRAVIRTADGTRIPITQPLRIRK